MSFWGLDNWKDGGEECSIVSDFNPDHFEDGCYRLALGLEAIVSGEASGSTGVRRNLNDDGGVRLLPGQFAYLITDEIVNIPETAIGLINISTSMKLRGVVNISGFHVDPGYSGRLIFTIFNAGGMAIHISSTDRIFRLWLSDYNGQASVKKAGFDKIPHDWADGLVGAYPSPFVVQQNLRVLSEKVDEKVDKVAERIDRLVESISVLRREVDETKSQRRTIVLGLIIITAFLLPFVASLYAGLFATSLQEPVGNISSSGATWLRSWLNVSH